MGLEQHRNEAPLALGFAVITVSDTRDETTDRGGAYLAAGLEAAGHRVVRREIIKDDAQAIVDAVRRAVGDSQVDLVLTTGGTGISVRDVTFDTLRGLFDSEIPGFGELFRWLSREEIGSATILSRAVGGLLERKVVLALPGSPKALSLALEEIVLPEAGHLVGQARA
ncbi:MAG: molybdenum cofactor biosynthesis protein B [Planctomycetota bacterium]|jgi:molybdenum cofactor biosynthesis protein B|nr:molybdenum cofactor biosynthesis protein B [Planctomycetota bacterium]MDP6955262.1 molybdenum cofactor biosynthesis protein B [Planctomycetota bacterium]